MNGVAISGKAAAGKNAFADLLSRELVERGLWPVEMNFAEGVKRELWETRGMRKEDSGGRDALLEIGHGRREADPGYWVRKLAEQVGSLSPFGGLPVITDMRYPNELEWAEANGFLTVRIDAFRVERMAALYSRGEDAYFCDSEHPSEVSLDDAEFGYRFRNRHGDILSLSDHVFMVADLLLGDIETVAAA